MSPRARSATRFGVLLALVTLFAAWASLLHGHPRLGVDDANIFFVYASNLADGHGFVYNVGGERVEGFTSLLWVLILTPLFALSPAPERLVLAVCLLLSASTLAIVTWYIDRLGIGQARSARWPLSRAAALCALLVLGSPAYVTWTTISLMDVSLWGFLLAATTVLVLSDADRPPRRSATLLSLLLALLVLARPEAMVLGPAFAGLRWLLHVAWGRGAKAASRDALAPLAALGVTLAGLTAFRLAYFGYPLPNTFYAKVSPSWGYNLATGSGYLWAYAGSGLVVGSSILLVVVALAWRLSKLATPRSRAIAEIATPSTLCALVTAALLLVPVLTGGDHFVWWRFYQPAYPILLLSVFALADDTRAALARRAVPWRGAAPLRGALALAAAVALLAAFLQGDASWRSLRSAQPLAPEFRIASFNHATGEVLAHTFDGRPALPSIGVIVAGGLKRTYPGEIVDLMGLNRVAMAHSPGDRQGTKNHAAFDKDVFFELMPDVVWTRTNGSSLDDYARPVEGEYPNQRFAATVLRNLPDDPRFQARYDFAAVRRDGSPYWMDAFYRTAFLDSLTASGRYEIRPVP